MNLDGRMADMLAEAEAMAGAAEELAGRTVLMDPRGDRIAALRRRLSAIVGDASDDGDRPHPAAPLDEAARRRPGWRDGSKVVLGDGQTWTFPDPWPPPNPLDFAESVRWIAGRLDFASAIKAIRDAWAIGDVPRAKEALGWRAASVLRLNYVLDDDECRALLARSPAYAGRAAEMTGAFLAWYAGNPEVADRELSMLLDRVDSAIEAAERKARS